MPSSGGKTCALDRKSTRLNSSHTIISYAVFCLKKTPRDSRPPAASPGGADERTTARARVARVAGGGQVEGWRGGWRAASRCVVFFLRGGPPPRFNSFPPPPSFPS